MKPDVKKVLSAAADAIKEKDVAVLLSGGIDSASIMFSLLDAGKTVTAYSFMLDGKMSTDFYQARRNAATFGVPFVPVFLPVDISTLKLDMKTLRGFGAIKKTDYECAWPMLYAYKEARETVVASGMGADGHFCISKKGMIHYRDRIDVFRSSLYSAAGYAQQTIHKKIADVFGKKVFTPYLTKEMQSEFLGTTWRECNMPKQKESILLGYPAQFSRMRVNKHTNLQLGDSGISEHFTRLLQTDWRRGSTVVGIYNALNRGELK